MHKGKTVWNLIQSRHSFSRTDFRHVGFLHDCNRRRIIDLFLSFLSHRWVLHLIVFFDNKDETSQMELYTRGGNKKDEEIAPQQLRGHILSLRPGKTKDSCIPVDSFLVSFILNASPDLCCNARCSNGQQRTSLLFFFILSSSSLL